MSSLVELTVDIVSAHVSRNPVSASELPTLIEAIYTALVNAGIPPKTEPAQVPAVSIRSSIKPEYLVCLEDGQKLKMLKRYLATRYGLTPADYRAKWGLPNDYPMVAPAYTEKRRMLARASGLGLRKVDAEPAKESLPEPELIGAPEGADSPPEIAPPPTAKKRSRPRKLSLKPDSEDSATTDPVDAEVGEAATLDG
ncbi:MucR family transcriptional regulator [Sphingomonas solaris]|uniref:MucR family transcriptional regulator n=1 Tax=Alterirhizorhabdus solaris TaxID=2529389 RepID=A0A558QWZ7_9SPHN|nr:MucR family transcriptional regulator [Sphingomonas solaris]